MSTSPFVPNLSEGVPDAASNDNRRRPAVTNTRAGVVPSPGQYPTPRRDTAPACGPPPISRCQITLPVSVSRATTVLPAERYMTPPMTSGTASEKPRPRPPPRPAGGGGKLNVQAFASFVTLPVLISVSGEKRVPA